MKLTIITEFFTYLNHFSIELFDMLILIGFNKQSRDRHLKTSIFSSNNRFSLKSLHAYTLGKMLLKIKSLVKIIIKDCIID